MKEMKQLRLESNGETRVLYHMNFWDGPISGVCLYNGKKCYFDTINEVHEERLMDEEEWIDYCVEMVKHGYDINPDDRNEYNWYRIYAIFETPDEVMEILDENHNLFKKHVGTHCNYNWDGLRPLDISIEDHKNSISQIDHSKFYGVEKRSANLEVKKWKILEQFIGPF